MADKPVPTRWTARAGDVYQSWEVVDPQGTIVAQCPAFDTPENAAKRAALFAYAPDLLEALSDLVETAEREVPEHMQSHFKKARAIIGVLHS